MYQYLRLTVLIMLIALTLTPTLAFAARCSDCGGEAHHDPNNCVKYAHASDCPCSECVDKKDTNLIDVLEELTDLMPFNSQAREVYNYLEERASTLSDFLNSETGRRFF